MYREHEPLTAAMGRLMYLRLLAVQAKQEELAFMERLVVVDMKILHDEASKSRKV